MGPGILQGPGTPQAQEADVLQGTKQLSDQVSLQLLQGGCFLISTLVLGCELTQLSSASGSFPGTPSFS